MPRASTAAENAAIGAVGSLIAYVSLHTADPGTTGASELSGGTYARVAITMGAASGGQIANTGAVTLNVPASTTVTHIGTWSAITGGTYYIGAVLSPTVTTGGSAGTVPFAIGGVVFPAS